MQIYAGTKLIVESCHILAQSYSKDLGSLPTHRSLLRLFLGGLNDMRNGLLLSLGGMVPITM